MKTINFELAKRLNDGGLLDNIDTEYYIDENSNIYNGIQNELCSAFDNIHRYRKLYKTLTLEEAIDFLPRNIPSEKEGYYGSLLIGKEYIDDTHYSNLIYNSRLGYDYTCIYYDFKLEIEVIGFKEKTLLEAIEKMLEYLLDNNLLTK